MTANSPNALGRIPPDGIRVRCCPVCQGMGICPPGPEHGQTCETCDGAGELVDATAYQETP
jgi:DnaJ-class molecular chaperone